MDRNREARRATIVGSNGFTRRRHRTNSLRDSPDDDGGVELQESVRLRDRVKKDRDRERGRERERERDLRERSSRSKRRRTERLTNNRDDIGDDETSDSVNDDEDEEDEENIASSVRFSPAVSSVSNHHHDHVSNLHCHSSNFSQQQYNSNITSNYVGSSSSHHLQHRKTFPPFASAKVLRAPPVWKSGDEMINVSVPRKARSASKRSHDWISSSSNNNSGGGDQNPAQPSISPARQNNTSTTSKAPPPPAPPLSPSCSNVSAGKKLKHSVNNTTGAKLKPLKVSSSTKPSSSNPEELEIEIAEVLYGLMTQSQGPSSSSNKEDSREVSRLKIDAKLFDSSPISNNKPIPGPNSIPLSVIAPKRKRPRQVPEIISNTLSAKPETDNVEKVSGSASENACEVGGKSVISQGQTAEPPSPVPESTKSDLEMKPVAEDIMETRDMTLKVDVSSSKELESPIMRAQDTKNGSTANFENQKEEKIEIDLMVPPPVLRLSRERESNVDLRTSAVDEKPVVSVLAAGLKPVVDSKGNEKVKGKIESRNYDLLNVAAEGRICEEADSNKEMYINLRLDLDKNERDVNENRNKMQLQTQKQQQSSKEEPLNEKPGHSTASSLPLPMSMASWPGGLPPLGYMAPIQGVVSMEGDSVTPAHIHQPLFSRPRPKRCATHCHIARNIHYLQQFVKMNHFWPAPAGSPASLVGSKPGNLNVVPPADLNMSTRVFISAHDKGQSVASIPSNVGKEKSAQPATSSDSTQRKQQKILIQHALPPVTPNNLLGPTFIFPLNHQQQAAMLARPGPARPPTTTTATSSTTTFIPSSTTSSSAPTPMSFNYANMSPNETQYLAILHNNGYPFPIPTLGATPPNYRGPPTQAMPLFNGSFYSSPIIQQQLSSDQPAQAHQNSTGSNNCSSQKQHFQSQHQQRPLQNSGSTSFLNNFTSQKAQQSNNHMPSREDNTPSATDNRGSRSSMKIYGQNFALPIHEQNILSMTPPSSASNSNQNEKKSNQAQRQKQGLRNGVDSLRHHTFAMSFGPVSGTPAGNDASSMSPNHASFQSCPEAVRQNIQMMAVAAQKNCRISEGKSGNVESSNKEEERKNFSFPRSNLVEAPVTSSSKANNVIESSARSLPASTCQPATTNGMLGTMNVVSNSHVQAQVQQQHQHMLQLKHHHQQQQQQMVTNAVNRNKPTSNGSIYSEHLNSSSMEGPSPKYQNTISPFGQNLIQSNSPSPSPSQSPQWKSSTRTPPASSQGPSSLSPSTVTMHKNLPQHHPRAQHTQISFGGNQKQQQSATPQGPPSSNNQVGSPTTSSISKGTSGSPRTTSSASTNNKMGHTSSFSAQPPKNGPSMPTQKAPSILGNSHGAKTPIQQQQQQSQPKTLPQAQLFFSNPYNSQFQSPNSISTSSTNAGPGGYYMQQRHPDQHQRGPGGPSPLTSSSSGVLISNTSTNDPATAIAAATCNVKGGDLQSQGVIHASPFGGQMMGMSLPAGFSHVHPVQTGVQVIATEQKNPAGNDSLHQWQPEKK